MLYLASQSPQRSALLHQAQLAFEIVSSSCDEESIKHADPHTCAMARAEAKARGADRRHCILNTDALILGVDTIVILAGQMIGKPRDRKHATEILQALQHSTHLVVTAHYGWRPAGNDFPERSQCLLSQTEITMRSMSATEIHDYVESGESDNRAGAYAIQETGDQFVENIKGDFDTVVGLHIPSVRELICYCSAD